MSSVPDASAPFVSTNARTKQKLTYRLENFLSSTGRLHLPSMIIFLPCVLGRELNDSLCDSANRSRPTPFPRQNPPRPLIIYLTKMYNDSGFSTRSLRGTDPSRPPPILRISMINLIHVIVKLSVSSAGFLPRMTSCCVFSIDFLYIP